MPRPKLVLLPYRYKSGVAYSVIPQDGSGDWDVDRNSPAYRMNENGVLVQDPVDIMRLDYFDPITGGIASCPSVLVGSAATNLSLRSQEFDNAYWTKNAGGINTAIGTNGIQPNVAVAPDGTTTADRINFINQANATLGMARLYTEPAASSTYTKSIYVKGEGADIGKVIKMNLRRGTGGYIESNLDITLTADWKRVELPLTLGAGNTQMNVYYYSVIGGATSALIWGAQFEVGGVATSYIPTVASAANRNADVITVPVPSGVSQIITTFQDGTTDIELTIPSTFTLPVGRIKSVVML